MAGFPPLKHGRLQPKKRTAGSSAAALTFCPSHPCHPIHGRRSGKSAASGVRVATKRMACGRRRKRKSSSSSPADRGIRLRRNSCCTSTGITGQLKTIFIETRTSSSAKTTPPAVPTTHRRTSRHSTVLCCICSGASIRPRPLPSSAVRITRISLYQ